MIILNNLFNANAVDLVVHPVLHAAVTTLGMMTTGTDVTQHIMALEIIYMELLRRLHHSLVVFLDSTCRFPWSQMIPISKSPEHFLSKGRTSSFLLSR